MRTGRKVLAGAAVALVGVLATGDLAGASITTNTIDSSAKLTNKGQAARGTIQIACTTDQVVKVTLTLTQGSVAATGQSAARCRGTTVAIPVSVVASGDPYVPGNAAACATARNYNRSNQLVDSRDWCLGGGVTLAF